MLAHILAIAVGLSSLVLFLTAFSMKEIHEKNDFLWSGVGLFYALVLWFCASRITGSVLLGQVAAVTLVLSFNWQNIKLRKAIANPHKEAEKVETNENTDLSIIQKIKGFFGSAEVSTPPSSITDILEEETEIENADQDITETESVEEISSFPSAETESVEEISSSTSTEVESVEDIAFFPSAETESVEEISPLPPTEADISTTESNNLIEEINTTSNLETELETISEQATVLEEIIVPTVDEEELVETQESLPIESNEPALDEEAITVPDITEKEVKDETNAEFNLESQGEEIKAEKPLDVEFTPSTIEEIEADPTSSIDDFLADLDNGVDKPAEDK